MGDLDGRIALITGASRGIGAAVAKGFAREGAHVVLIARTVGGLEEVDDAIRAEGGQATLLPMDLLKIDDIDLLGPTLAERFGRLDIAVANAAMLGTMTPLTHMDAREWQKVIDLNLNANFRLIRTLDPLLQKSDAGRMLFVSTGMADGAHAYWGAYAASKAALEALARTYAAETASTNLRVNLLLPGLVKTAMLDKAYPGGYQGDPLMPEDTVQTFLDLASPACRLHGERVCVPVPKALDARKSGSGG